MTEQATARGLPTLRAGDHLCCFYESDEEHEMLLAPFLKHGLLAGDRVIYAYDQFSPETIVGYLQRAGLEAGPYLESGQLILLPSHEVYLAGGAFDPEAVIAMLEEAIQQARSDGYHCARLSGEVSWARDEPRDLARLVGYEELVTDRLRGQPYLALCLYDWRIFDPDLLLDVLRAHPGLFIGG